MNDGLHIRVSYLGGKNPDGSATSSTLPLTAIDWDILQQIVVIDGTGYLITMMSGTPEGDLVASGNK